VKFSVDVNGWGLGRFNPPIFEDDRHTVD